MCVYVKIVILNSSFIFKPNKKTTSYEDLFEEKQGKLLQAILNEKPV